MAVPFSTVGVLPTPGGDDDDDDNDNDDADDDSHHPMTYSRYMIFQGTRSCYPRFLRPTNSITRLYLRKMHTACGEHSGRGPDTTTGDFTAKVE